MNIKVEFRKHLHKLPSNIQTFSGLNQAIANVFKDRLPRDQMLGFKASNGEVMLITSEEDFESLTQILKDENLKSVKIQIITNDSSLCSTPSMTNQSRANDDSDLEIVGAVEGRNFSEESKDQVPDEKDQVPDQNSEAQTDQSTRAEQSEAPFIKSEEFGLQFDRSEDLDVYFDQMNKRDSIPQKDQNFQKEILNADNVPQNINIALRNINIAPRNFNIDPHNDIIEPNFNIEPRNANTEPPKMKDTSNETFQAGSVETQTEKIGRSESQSQTEGLRGVEEQSQTEKLGGIESHSQTEDLLKMETFSQTERLNKVEEQSQTDKLNSVEGQSQTENKNQVESQSQTDGVVKNEGQVQTDAVTLNNGQVQTDSLNKTNGAAQTEAFKVQASQSQTDSLENPVEEEKVARPHNWRDISPEFNDSEGESAYKDTCSRKNRSPKFNDSEVENTYQSASKIKSPKLLSGMDYPCFKCQVNEGSYKNHLKYRANCSMCEGRGMVRENDPIIKLIESVIERRLTAAVGQDSILGTLLSKSQEKSGVNEQSEVQPSLESDDKAAEVKSSVQDNSEVVSEIKSETKPILDESSNKIKKIPEDNIHHGFSCDGCGTQPIEGVRQHCEVCLNFDQCATCEQTSMHTHPLVQIDRPQSPLLQSVSRRSVPGQMFNTVFNKVKNLISGSNNNDEQELCVSFAEKSQRIVQRAKLVKQPRSKIEIAPKKFVDWVVEMQMEEPAWPEGTNLQCIEGLYKGQFEEVPRVKPGKACTIVVMLESPEKAGKQSSLWRLGYMAKSGASDKMRDDNMSQFGPRIGFEMIVESDEKKRDGNAIQCSNANLISQPHSQKALDKAKALQEIFKGDIKSYFDFIQNAKLEELSVEEVVQMYLDSQQAKN